MIDIKIERIQNMDGRYSVIQDGTPVGILSRSGDAWVFDCRLDNSISKSPDPVMVVARKLAQIYLSSSPAGAGNK